MKRIVSVFVFSGLLALSVSCVTTDKPDASADKPGAIVIAAVEQYDLSTTADQRTHIDFALALSKTEKDRQVFMGKPEKSEEYEYTDHDFYRSSALCAVVGPGRHAPEGLFSFSSFSFNAKSNVGNQRLYDLKSYDAQAGKLINLGLYKVVCTYEDGGLVKWKVERKPSDLALKQFKAEHPAVYEKYKNNIVNL